MTPTEILVLVLMIGYAIYRQSRRHEVVGATRFKLAGIYALVGLVMGGYHVPDQPAEWALLLGGLVLSLVVGLARGRLTRVEVGADGLVYSQGTALTIGLFLGMVAVKFAMGTWAYFAGVADGGGFGEVLLMIAVMVALQSEIQWRRARPLGARTTTTPAVPTRV